MILLYIVSEVELYLQRRWNGLPERGLRRRTREGKRPLQLHYIQKLKSNSMEVAHTGITVMVKSDDTNLQQ